MFLLLLKDHHYAQNYKYNELEKLGVLRIFTVRESDTKKLIGYNSFFVSPNIHLKDCLDAVNDAIYIRKDSRKLKNGFIASDLIKYSETELKKSDVNRVIYLVPCDKKEKDWSKLISRIDYKDNSKMMIKELD